MITIKNVSNKNVTNDSLNEYNEVTKNTKKYFYSALDFNMDLPIITINFGGDYEKLTMVNPIYKEVSDDKVVYFERDARKGKVRKTVRYKRVQIETDNLGVVEFSSDKDSWETQDEYMEDSGLFECIVAQRLIDAINGIDITHEARLYNPQLKSEKKYGRNERVMLQSSEGEMIFVKYKKAQPYLDKGYQII